MLSFHILMTFLCGSSKTKKKATVSHFTVMEIHLPLAWRGGDMLTNQPESDKKNNNNKLREGRDDVFYYIALLSPCHTYQGAEGNRKHNTLSLSCRIFLHLPLSICRPLHTRVIEDLLIKGEDECKSISRLLAHSTITPRHWQRQSTQRSANLSASMAARAERQRGTVHNRVFSPQ